MNDKVCDTPRVRNQEPQTSASLAWGLQGIIADRDCQRWGGGQAEMVENIAERNEVRDTNTHNWSLGHRVGSRKDCVFKVSVL